MTDRKAIVLIFANLPKYFGGRQTGGLSMVNWQATEGINSLNSDVEVVLFASDYHKESDFIGYTRVLGWNSRLLINYGRKHPVKALCHGLQAIRLRFIFKQPVLKSWAKILCFDYCIDKVHPCIIQLRGIDSALLAGCLIGVENIRKILRLGGVNGYDAAIPAYLLWRRIEQYIARQDFDAVFFNSNGTGEEWQRRYGAVNAPSYVVLNGYDQAVFNCDQKSEKVSKVTSRELNSELHLMTIGSIQELKGQIRVVRAIGRLPNPDAFHYICAGAGSPEYVKKLRAEAAFNKVSLELTGYINQHELAKLLKTVDYMILSSTSEGFGSAYIESIACGTPVIIPKGLPLAQEPDVLNDKNAIFIDGPDEDSIRKCLERLRPSSVLPEEISETVSHLSREKVGMRYIEIFKQVIERDACQTS